ncbi:MAG: acyltransferase [Microbacteriaceae bacterium]|nr:acyltransferase [Microbacteriaceae bacterium]
MATASLPRTRTARLGGLDGLRAIAVSLVLIYHLWPEALPGGFLGVDVFFVISGFLITSLLLSEHRIHGRIRLGEFWRRRARRLLPALALVILICTSVALVIGGDVLVNIAAQIGGAAAFIANWVYIALGSDYFARDNPELFRNTWSLAIEEQFYLVLPLVLLLALRMRGRATRTLFFTTGAIASATWMVTLSLNGANPTRVYFGTDSHTFGLLIGVALACALGPRSTDRAVRPVWQQLGLAAATVLGLAVLGVLAFTLREGSPESFQGGFQLATLAALISVWAATRDGAWIGRALDVAPLRWIGARSYGLYLWHWPILVIMLGWAKSSGVADADGAAWLVPISVLVLTVAATALSYRFVEQPIRRLGIRRSMGVLLHPLRLHGARLASASVLVLLIALTLPTTIVAMVTAPAQSSAASAIDRGSAALDDQQQRARLADAQRAAHTSANETKSPSNDDDPGAFNPNWQDAPDFELPPPPPPDPIQSWELFAVGDSVMLASVPELAAAFPEIWVDASVSRGLSAGVDIVTDFAARGELRPVIIVGLGTNGPVSDADLERLLHAANGRKVVIVNAYGDRWWIPEVNRQLRAFADAHRGVALADWESAIVQVPGGLAGDDIHPNPSGGVAYAQVVQRALDELITPAELPEPERPVRVRS